jgi:hypothetical protein
VRCIARCQTPRLSASTTPALPGQAPFDECAAAAASWNSHDHPEHQDEESCVVFGMPKEAIKRGGVEKTLALGAMAQEIQKQL